MIFTSPEVIWKIIEDKIQMSLNQKNLYFVGPIGKKICTVLYGGGDDKHCVEKLDPSNDVNDP